MDLQHFETYSSYIPSELDLLSLNGFFIANIVISFFILVRYFLMVLPFHFIRKSKARTNKQQGSLRPLKENQIAYEIKYSMLSTVFFSLSGYFIAVVWDLQISQIYLKFDQYGLAYLPASFVIYAFVHEIYFYFTHVWMHQPHVFKLMHRVHHFSNPTSPWASFSFHPLECLVHAAFLPIMVLLVPIHPTVLIAYLTFMTITAISNHLDFEIIPWKLIRQQFISGTHHGLHHKLYKGNYGLYFCFIDRLMKTEIADSSPKNQKSSESSAEYSSAVAR